MPPTTAVPSEPMAVTSPPGTPLAASVSPPSSVACPSPWPSLASAAARVADDAVAAAGGGGRGGGGGGGGGENVPAAPSLTARLVALRAQLAAMPRHEPAAAGTAADTAAGRATALAGGVVELPGGPVHVVDYVAGAPHLHGEVPLAWAAEPDPALLAALALSPALARIDPARLLYLDTETTGLAGGAGTTPFLVGLGWYEGGSLRHEQLLLRSPADEPALLRHLAGRLRAASALVTFNGKSFDWPLLCGRYVLARQPVPPPMAHVDLLHCARRLCAHRGAAHRLIQLERDLLRFFRVGDVPGSVVPAIYFAYLRGAPAHTLAGVLTHNQHDITTMAALLGVLLRRLARPAAQSAADLLACARLWQRAGASARADAFAAAAADAALDPATRQDALALRARLARRRGECPVAASHLHAALGLAPALGAVAAGVHLELAKLYEHRLGDLARAEVHARAAAHAGAEPPAESLHRLARLARRRAARAAGRARGIAAADGGGAAAAALAPVRPADCPRRAR